MTMRPPAFPALRGFSRGGRCAVLAACATAGAGCRASAPVAVARAPAAAGAPVVATAPVAPAPSVFAGEDLSWFRAPHGEWMVAGDVVADPADAKKIAVTPGRGVIANGAGGKDVHLTSVLEHGDVEAHVEFLVPKDSNSGVYFQSRYEIQILDSFGVESPRFSDCGGVYARWNKDKKTPYEGRPPRVNASRPAGVWQSFDVVFRAPRFDAAGKKVENARFVKVVHNGTVVSENVELSGPTRAAPFDDERPSGPLMLQGDHGPVAFRNIVLRPLAGAAPASAVPPARPNVLFIVADDLNTTLGCYGDKLVKTPHIDRLAARGVTFERAYCQYSLCNPSRASFLSGRRPEVTGVHDNRVAPRARMPDAVFLPQHFRRHGYFTGRADKIFHITQGMGDNFDDPASWDVVEDVAATHYPEPKRFADRVRRQGRLWAALDINDEDTGDGQVARRVARMMETAVSAGKPFFLAAGFRKPHATYAAPLEDFARYRPEQILLPVEPAEHLASIPVPARAAVRFSVAEMGAAKLAYHAAISFLDRQVGLLLDTVDRLGLRDRTIVVFLGDHGYHLGEHGGLWHKMTLFEEGARVPLVIATPTGARGAVSPRTVELVDLYPTLVDLASLPAPPGLAGTSLAPLLARPDAPWTRPAFTMIHRAGSVGRSVRTEQHRYTEWDGGARGRELYDHGADPREHHNLADDPAQREVAARMKALLATVAAP